MLIEKSPADARYARPSQTSVAKRTFPANTDFTAYIRFLNSYGHPYDQEIDDLYETPVFETVITRNPVLNYRGQFSPIQIVTISFLNIRF